MKGRQKFRVWSEEKQRWRTCFVLPAMLMANMSLLKAYGIKFRVC